MEPENREVGQPDVDPDDQQPGESLDDYWKRMSTTSRFLPPMSNTRIRAWALPVQPAIREVIYATRPQWASGLNAWGVRYCEDAMTVASMICRQLVIGWREGCDPDDTGRMNGIHPIVVREAWKLFDARNKEVPLETFRKVKTGSRREYEKAYRLEHGGVKEKRPKPMTTFSMMRKLDWEDTLLAREQERKEMWHAEERELGKAYEAFMEAMSTGVDKDGMKRKYRRAYQIAQSRRPERDYLQNFPNPL